MSAQAISIVNAQWFVNNHKTQKGCKRLYDEEIKGV